jgi:solute carrier family 25 iron transporter 28/37
MSGIVLTATQTRMQILNPTPSAVYNGMIQGGYRIATGEGILSLWRGMSSVVVGAGLYIWVVRRGDNR